MIHPFHAHIYFKLQDTALAETVRHNIALAIPQLTYVGRLIAVPIGPHPLPMFEIHIPAQFIEAVRLTIDSLRQGLSVLIHPVQHDELEAHSQKAMWLGQPLTLKLDIFK